MAHGVCGRPAPEEWLSATVPGSVYSDLLANNRMEDPYWRDNENAAFALMENDYEYERKFTVTAEQLAADALLLDCQGLDTLATIYVNGEKAAYRDNMHRIWDIDIKAYVHEGENELRIVFSSPLKYMRAKNAECYVEGSCDCTEGFPHIRKAHCMMGWDWGPRLPDAGIWRCINLLAVDRARLISVRIHQEHKDGKVELSFYPDIKTYGGRCSCKEPDYGINVTVTAPNGTQFTSNGAPIVISNPELWWPNGYGAQPLYKVEAVLTGEGRDLDKWNARIGLRTMTMTREKDEWGEAFYAYGSTALRYSPWARTTCPEDNMIPAQLRPSVLAVCLKDCKLPPTINSIRVWGGGYYPDDWFYDACDELGLIVWQDFMFACSMYELIDPNLKRTSAREFVDNISRLRHHASLGLWCGNNEMEIGRVCRSGMSLRPSSARDYIKMYEYIIPQELAEHDPDTFYWPASPSSGGGFRQSRRSQSR